MKNMTKVLAFAFALVLAQNNTMEAAQTVNQTYTPATPFQTVNKTYIPTRAGQNKPANLRTPATPLYPVNSSGPNIDMGMKKMGYQDENPTSMTNLQPIEKAYITALQTANKALGLEPLNPAQQRTFAELKATSVDTLTALNDLAKNLNPAQLNKIQKLKQAAEGTIIAIKSRPMETLTPTARTKVMQDNMNAIRDIMNKLAK